MRAMEIKASLVTEDFEAAAALLELFSKYVVSHHELSQVNFQANEIEVSNGHQADTPEPEPPLDDPAGMREVDGPWVVEEDG